MSFARPASWNMPSACSAGTPSARAYARMTGASSCGTSNGRPLILDSPDFDLKRAFDQQIELLELRRERIGNLIDMAKALRSGEGNTLEFVPFGQMSAEGADLSRRSGSTRAYASEEGRAAALPSFLERCNWARPHSACGGLPPMSRIVGVNNVMAHNS